MRFFQSDSKPSKFTYLGMPHKFGFFGFPEIKHSGRRPILSEYYLQPYTIGSIMIAFPSQMIHCFGHRNIEPGLISPNLDGFRFRVVHPCRGRYWYCRSPFGSSKEKLSRSNWSGWRVRLFCIVPEQEEWRPPIQPWNQSLPAPEFTVELRVNTGYARLGSRVWELKLWCVQLVSIFTLSFLSKTEIVCKKW